MLSTLIKIVLALGGLYLLFLLGLYLGQRRLVYVPNPERVSPGSVGLTGVEEITFAPEPGVQIIAWYAKARSTQPTILYFHGNAGNLAGRADRVKYFQDEGYGVLIMSYRSYGGSTGVPSERANISDALHALNWLRGQVSGTKDIVLYGESLGTGVAVQVAAQSKVAGVILDAPYSSLVDVAQNAYPYLPVRPFLRDRYESDKYIEKINAPLLILHGGRDEIVQIELGQALFQAAVQPKKMVVFPEGNHSDLYDHGAIGEVRKFIQNLGR